MKVRRWREPGSKESHKNGGWLAAAAGYGLEHRSGGRLLVKEVNSPRIDDLVDQWSGKNTHTHKKKTEAFLPVMQRITLERDLTPPTPDPPTSVTLAR